MDDREVVAEAQGSSSTDASQNDRIQELSRLRAELEEYQCLIEDLPQIYEVKFRGQVRGLAQDIRSLLDQRQCLQQQIGHCLEGGSEHHRPRLARAVAPLRLAVARRWLRRLSPWRLAMVAAAGGLGLSLVVGQLLRTGRTPVDSLPASRVSAARPSPQPLSSPPPKPAEAQLRLRAIQEEVWVELRSLDERSVFVKTLQPGEEKTLPIGNGLRIRAGRPHLLQIALADQPFSPLGAVNDFRWRILKLPPDVQPVEPASNASDSSS